ncbi:MAG: efflux RND transporter periplasmic adaptor subunit [Vicinamibacterales bacterium]
MSQRVERAGVAVCLAVCLSACQSKPGAAGPGGPGGPPGGFPAMGVEVITVAPSTIEETTEFIGTVKSRRSVTVQPQVEGFVTRIAVTSGARVAAGAVLMEIDAGRQEATVATLEAQRAAREADLAFWRQQTTRLKTLLDAGAVSQQEYDQAAATLKGGEAQVAAIDQQIREQKVELGYHRVLAPAAGIVGDIPVRTGDRVTRATELTTIDDNQALEVYLPVPVQQAPELKPGLPVRLVNDRGETVTDTKITFIAPSVDPATQSVLAKAALDRPEGLRNDQFVRARIVWRASEGLKVPVVAVTRVNGRYFAFLAEKGAQGTTAHQRAIEVGPMIGNDYVVLKGLNAGDSLIVSGVQKIGDGMPVTATPAGAAPAAAPSADAKK